MTDTDIALLRIIRDDIDAALPALKAAADRLLKEDIGHWNVMAAVIRLSHASGLTNGVIDIETKEAA